MTGLLSRRYPAALMLMDALRPDQPRTIDQLATYLGVTRREVEQAIQDLRLAGWPVATSGKGVWRATTRAELEQQYRSHRERALNQLKGCRGIRKAMQAMEPVQIEIWDAA